MVFLKDIKGQDSSVKFLKKNISSGRIANSYLFSGPEGVGRSLTAKAFAASLICRSRRADAAAEACGSCSACVRVDSLSHPDLIWIKPEKNKVIKVEEARDIKDRLSLKPFEAQMSVCVIDDAHMLNREAANALLKILEEPPGHSVIVLITSKKELLPETVVSRCSEVRFRCLLPGDTRDILIAKCGVDAEKAEFFSYFSQGSPGKALEMIANGIGERRKEIAGFLDKISGERNVSFMDWPSDEKSRLLEDIEMIIMFCRDAVMSSGNKAVHVLDGGLAGEELKNYFGRCSPDRIYRTVERLVELKTALMGNINPKIVAQVLPASLKK